MENLPSCGGSIISTFHVLTAAHCCLRPGGVQIPPSDIFVAVGNIDLYDRTIRRDVYDTYVHEEFNETTFINDIAVLSVGIAHTLFRLISISTGSHCLKLLLDTYKEPVLFEEIV